MVSPCCEAVLAHVPRVRTNDLVYLNPADTERPIGFNPLAQVPDRLKPIVADGVVSAFRHVWPESWGPRLDYILTNAVRALLDVPGATLPCSPACSSMNRSGCSSSTSM